jgi:hypothetical protein
MRIGIGILVGALLVSVGAACSQIDAGGSDELSGRSSGSESDALKARIAKLTLEEGGLVKQRGEVSEKLSKAQAEYKGLVEKRKNALRVLTQNDQAMSDSGSGTLEALQTVDDVSITEFNNSVNKINSLVKDLSAIDKRLAEIDKTINELTSQMASSKLASIKKHREAKRIKVNQLKRQLADLESSYEGYWRCISFDDLKKGLLSNNSEIVAAAAKVEERAKKCSSLSDQLVSKRAELNQGFEELAAANELLRKTLSGDSQKASAGSNRSVPLDATAGCYKLQSAGPLFKTPDTTDAWGPNSKPNASGFAIGSGALVYIHKRVPSGRLQVTAKSGTFLGRSGYVPESISRTKVDGTLCE